LADGAVVRLTRLAEGAADGLCILGETFAAYESVASPKHPQRSRVVLRQLSDDLFAVLAAAEGRTNG
jgi:hypothetical protein